ncbi:NADP-dependent oxidoreductase domain-containing protein [Aspergillus aurantiobrunneus]
MVLASRVWAGIPALGFGTFQDPDSQEDTVSRALQKGVRLINTARVYNVEEQVGKGIQQLWCSDYHPDDVERALDDSLRDLNTPYVDLLLMHYPCTFKRGHGRFPRDADGRMSQGHWRKGSTEWLKTNGIHVVQFSPLGNMNDFYHQTGWSKEIAMKYNKSPVQVVLAWGIYSIYSGRSVIPKSVVDWQIDQNLEADFELQAADMAQIATLNEEGSL